MSTLRMPTGRRLGLHPDGRPTSSPATPPPQGAAWSDGTFWSDGTGWVDG
jgi:hypothetical protein